MRLWSLSFVVKSALYDAQLLFGMMTPRYVISRAFTSFVHPMLVGTVYVKTGESVPAHFGWVRFHLFTLCDEFLQIHICTLEHYMGVNTVVMSALLYFR